LICTLIPLSADADLASLEGRFRNEVIDQDLRRRIARETENTRNLILAMAFSKTGLSG
jgi:His-Xaa-Ser system protein HxsD